MWLSIRSQALTRRWMENYKQSKKKSTKRAIGLRKELKNKGKNKEAMGKGKNEEIGEERKQGEDRKEEEREEEEMTITHEEEYWKMSGNVLD